MSMSINPDVTLSFMKQRKEPFSLLRHDVYPAISPAQGLKTAATGMRVLVTGAGRGVGRCTALYFAHAGAKQITVTARSKDQLEETKKMIEEAFPATNVSVVTGSVVDAGDVARVFDAAGEIDVLVHNAGVAGTYCSVHESTEEWWETFEANVKGTHLYNREFLRRTHDGTKISRPITIIDVSSRSSLSTFPGASGYSCGKAAINRLVEYIHTEYPENVRAFAIHPGAIPTALSHGVLKENARAGLIDTAELAAGAILWLATQSQADFLRGRYFSANWDVDEVLRHRELVERDGLLLTTVVGGARAWL